MIVPTPSSHLPPSTVVNRVPVCAETISLLPNAPTALAPHARNISPIASEISATRSAIVAVSIVPHVAGHNAPYVLRTLPRIAEPTNAVPAQLHPHALFTPTIFVPSATLSMGLRDGAMSVSIPYQGRCSTWLGTSGANSSDTT